MESKTNLNALAAEVHQNAVDHGWWDEPRSFGDIIALCHSELSEALEEYRAGRPMVYCEPGMRMNQSCTNEDCSGIDCWDGQECTTKPEGIAVEMVDCIIRILDWCGKEGVDVDKILAVKHEYNKTRPYKHGGKVL